MFDLRGCFISLTDNVPFDWQERLFQKFLNGDFPDACDVPTGLGKTSVMAIWLIALGSLLKDKDRKIPLRLVYVVDRRVIVDQATDEAERLLDRITQTISDKSSPLHPLAQTFREASMKGDESLIALSTLRGQKADNREWCLDPSRPAIIIGTVDMIGSRLLFSGYGKVGINHRSLQAGLLGQDTLVVIDEAHLSPVFVSTIFDIKRAIYQTPLLRPFHVISLSATLSKQVQPLEIDEQKECQNEKARLRLNAKKQIEWLPFDQLAKVIDSKKNTTSKEINEAFAEHLVNRAIQYEDKTQDEPARSVVIFVQTVDMVNLIADKLSEKLEEITTQVETEEPTDKKEKGKIHKAIEARILKITGEMRGAERDRLVNTDKFKAFLPDRDRQTPRLPYYLIATSSAEVGVNLDADHGLCDLSTLDSMIQRIGRINRFGKTESTITVVIDEKVLAETGEALSRLEERQRELNTDKARKAFRKARSDFDRDVRSHRFTSDRVFYTWRALKSKAVENGKINASPLALRGLLAVNPKALPEPPVRPPFDEARLDDWAMTSLTQSEYPRPLVQYWLRGIIDDERAQTTFVWRADLDHFDLSNLSEEKAREQLQEAEELATTIPIQPQERANVATPRAGVLLKALAGKFANQPIVLIDASGEVKAYPLLHLKDKDNKYLFALFSFSTVILPCSVGGLDNEGNPLDKLPKESKSVDDVVGDEWTRYLIIRYSSDSFSTRNLGEKDSEEVMHLSLQDALKGVIDAGVWINKTEFQRLFSKENGVVSYVACFFNRTVTDHFLREDVDDIASLGLKMRTVDEHDADVERYVRNLAGRIGLPEDIIELLAAAGFRHDLGKARDWWQKAIGNFSAEYFAKSDNNSFDHSFNQGYRHEFGSLVESLDDEGLKAHPHRDLILHLIATHHGFARPHFPERAFDRNQPKPLNQQIAHETLLRFNRLQQQYGWWQLAYLEAILKAADAMASRDFSRGEL